MKKVTKADLIGNIYQTSKYERQTVQAVVEEFMEELKKQIVEGNTVELRGFGTFELKLRNGRKAARNPKTGETHDVAPHYIAHFRPGQEIKNSVLTLTVGEK